MTKAQAMQEAKRRWGTRAIIRFTEGAALQPAREQASARIKEIRARCKEIEAVPGFRQTDLGAEHRRLIHEREDLFGVAISYRYSVGELMDILAAFHVKGQGDTWEKAFAVATERYPSDGKKVRFG